MSDTNNKWLEYVAHALSGMCGGVTAVTVFFPLDTLRTRQQVASKDERLVRQTVAQGLYRILKEEGLVGWYRGLSSSVLCIAVSNLVYFFYYNLLKDTTLKLRGKKALSVAENLLIGAVAGAINVLSTNPIWVVNMRLKLQSTKQSEQGIVYKGMLHGLWKIYNDEGVVNGLWRGMGASLLLVSNPSINFMVYERIKRIWFKFIGAPGPLGIFLIGAMAKTVATTITYPIQTIQSRLRAFRAKATQGQIEGSSIRGMMMQIWKEEGFLGFFHGVESKMIQTVSAAALMFLVYEQILRTVTKLVRLVFLGRLKVKA